MTAAAMAKPLSNPLTLTTATAATGREAGAATAPLGAAGRCAVVAAGAAAVTRAAVATGAAAARGGAAGTEMGAGAAAPKVGGGGPPAGKVGSLIVGAEVGFGGKLMRTVSFFGWILAASAGFGGIAPDGTLGVFSDISFSSCYSQIKVGARVCQTQLRDFVEFLTTTVCHHQTCSDA